MKRLWWLGRLSPAILAALILAPVSPVCAEVSAGSTEAGTYTLVFAQITDGGDPIGSGIWHPYRLWAMPSVLNPEGEVRGDGMPDIATLPSGSPLVVWSYNAGVEHDVVVAEWAGDSWGPITVVAGSPADELDPRVFVDATGSAHVVWWEEAMAARVLYSMREAGAVGWTVPVQVNPAGETGRRPSVLLDGVMVKIAYERDAASPATGQEVVVASRQSNGTFIVEAAATTARTDRLDPVLNLDRGTMWVDWMEDGQSFGCARWTGSEWESSAVVPWANATWIGAEDMRRTVRRFVLLPQ